MTPLQLVKQRREINMRIVLLGATGFVGSALLVEASHRGHKVTAIVRHPKRVVGNDALPGKDRILRHEPEGGDHAGLPARAAIDEASWTFLNRHRIW